MGFDSAGNLYVAGGYDGKIHRIAPDGSKTTMDSGFAHPKHLAVYSNGNIYVVDSGGTLIVMITLDGGKTSLVDLGETISGMATDGEYLYVSHSDKISRIDTSGQVTQIATDLDQPSSLTVCNGSVFVTVSDGIVKLKISPVSGALKISDLQPGPEDGKDVHVYSYTYRNWDNANWGTYPVLVVSYKGIHLGVDCIDRTYIEFDLSSLPSDREIANATLSLYCYNQEGESAEYAVYRVTEPWAEGEGAYHSGEVEPTAPEPWITWNRQPSFDSTQAYATEFIAPGSAPRWINLDVTKLVENWYDGSLPNYGIVLRLVEENGSVKVLYFHSSESEEAELRPKLVVTFSGGEQPVPTPSAGLVLHLPFDGSYNDTSGYGNNGAPKGNMRFTPGVVGQQAAYFDGKSYVEIPDSNSLDLSGAFTFSVWLYKEDAGSGGWAVVLSKGDTAATDDNSPYGLIHASGLSPTVRLTKDNRYNYVTSAGAKTDFKQWHHLGVTWDGRDVKFYVDGVLTDTQTWEGPLPNSARSLLIGCDPPGATEYFRGMMDDLRIYDYALSASDVQSVYSSA